ncbi:MAG: peptidyl-prolyl cis-trans isomerase [Acidobacteria bacterium]|nr:peptidyl-prolyl cis-trans isomerase [Acidobacteriota bacterium]
MKEGLANDPEVVNQLSLLRENLVANAEIARLEKSIKVSDEDLKKAYDANVKDYEQVTARHILIAFKGSPAAQPGKKELTEEEAKAKAEDLRKQIVAGADFAELAKKESDDTGSGSRGGDLGAFGPNQMVPEFEQAAFAAKVGEVTPVVRTQYGYHVIKVEKHDSTPFDQVKATLERAEAKKRLQDQLDALKAEAKPVYNDTYFAVPAAPPAAAAEAPASSPDSKPATTASPDMTSKKP